MRPIVSLIPALLLVRASLAAESAAAEHDPSVDAAAIRACVQQAVPFIEREGVTWIEKRQCVTCHQVPFMLWSLNAAEHRGFAVDAGKLREWNAWGTDDTHFVAAADREKRDRNDVLKGNVDTMAQLLLAGAAAGTKPEGEWAVLFRDQLLLTQQETGRWVAGGQLPGQKRQKHETEEVTTLWAILALASYSESDTDQSFPPAIDRAREALNNKADGESTEWWAAQLLVARRLQDAEEVARFRAGLLQRQRDDGGWGWLCAEDSDAFGTGLALYALARDGTAADDSVVQRAQRFLLRTQQPDGSWPVRGTKQSARTKPTPTATYWGTCWGVLGLVESLGKPLDKNRDDAAGKYATAP